MPVNAVHTPREEGMWEKAKELTKEQYGSVKWPVVMHIYMNQRKANKVAGAKKVKKSVVLAKSYGDHVHEELGGGFAYPLAEKGYKLRAVSEVHGDDGGHHQRHEFVNRGTNHLMVLNTSDHPEHGRTTEWTHHSSSSGHFKQLDTGKTAGGMETHLNMVHKSQGSGDISKGMKCKDCDLPMKHTGFTMGDRSKAPSADHALAIFGCPSCGRERTGWKKRDKATIEATKETMKSQGGEEMDISKAFEHRTMDWIAALFGYHHANPAADMGEVAGLGKGATGEYTNPLGYGLSITARPTAQAFELRTPTGEALYSGVGKHELYTALRKQHQGPFTFVTDNNKSVVGLVTDDVIQKSGTLLLFKAKKGSKGNAPLPGAGSKKQQRQLAFKQFSQTRLKKTKLAKPKPVKKSGAVCANCDGAGAIAVMYKSADDEPKYGFRICPSCNNHGEPIEKGLLKVANKWASGKPTGLKKQISKVVAKVTGNEKPKIGTPKVKTDPNAKSTTVHMYSGMKNGEHQFEKVHPQSRADAHVIAERERKGAHVLNVEGHPNRVHAFMTERALHHSEGGEKNCAGCRYHKKVGALKGAVPQNEPISLEHKDAV